MQKCHGETTDLKTCKRDTVKTAKQLLYSQKVIDEIRQAKTIPEIYRIMHMARKGEE